ncbi:50S ribosomal [Babesia ovis]|uniref:50S ribosomal n=1 Tax=Babesia ovis TaxID=5869 RepID=A0A9W5WUR8_BABOV|nr:50S ribosomal [Babesia ovis]
MLYTSSYFNVLVSHSKWLHKQTRCKKYLPFYLDTVKRAAHKRLKTRSQPQPSDPDISTSPVSSTNFVSRLATPSEALEILRSLKCSLGDLDNSGDQHLFRLWTKVDVKRVALRGMAMLPHPVGPKPRVVAICEDDEAKLAMECGASYAGLDNILERIAGGWTNFDTCVTTTVHMPKLVKVARILGPKKLMPNMKEGTLATNLLDAIRRMSSANSVQFRALPIDDAEFTMLQYMTGHKKFDFDVDHIGVLEVPIARGQASPQNIVDNAKHFIREVMRQRPTTATKTTATEFQWPPTRRNPNSIFESFGSFENEGQSVNEFILAGAFGIAQDGKALTDPVMVDINLLM